jgi:ornithine cyclodeaminase/alanine dehydrogenase-like protein (mu-crystallin family)
MREIPDGIWQAAEKVYIELPFACEESGDLSQPLAAGVAAREQICLFGEFLQTRQAGAGPAIQGTQYFKSVGMGVFDTLAAKVIADSAREKGLGQTLCRE